MTKKMVGLGYTTKNLQWWVVPLPQKVAKIAGIALNVTWSQIDINRGTLIDHEHDPKFTNLTAFLVYDFAAGS